MGTWRIIFSPPLLSFSHLSVSVDIFSFSRICVRLFSVLVFFSHPSLICRFLTLSSLSLGYVSDLCLILSSFPPPPFSRLSVSVGIFSFSRICVRPFSVLVFFSHRPLPSFSHLSVSVVIFSFSRICVQPFSFLVSLPFLLSSVGFCRYLLFL